MTGRTLCFTLVWLALGIPASLDAQIGRLRQRVQEAVGGEKKAEQPEVDRSKVFTGDVIEITASAMKGFRNGLDTELGLLTEFAALLDTYRSAEDYNRCEQDLAMSAEGMEVMGRMAAVPDNVTPEEMQRIIARVNEEFLALKKRKCGPSVVEDWPQAKRTEKLQEIATRAAAAAGPVRSPEPPPPSGPSVLDDSPYFWTQQEGLTLQQYIIFKERVTAYCAYKKRKGDAMPVTPGDGNNLSFEAGLLDGTGNKAMWVFTAAEVKELDDHCDGVVVTIGRITEIIEMAPINIYGKRK